METSYFSIAQPQYNISCKLYIPTAGCVKTVVVGVHGFCGDKESSALLALAEQLTTHNSVLFCFDFPAHGKSEASDTMLTVDNCRNDLLTVLEYAREQFPGTEMAVFATSFGGYITLLSLKKMKNALSRLILRAPAVHMSKVFRDRILQDSFSEYRNKKETVYGFDRKIKITYSFYEELVREDAFSVGIEIPTLLIRATCDELVDPIDLAAFVEKNTAVKLLDVKGAGHRFKGAGELQQVVDATMDWLFAAL